METKDPVEPMHVKTFRKPSKAQPFAWIKSVILSVVILTIISGFAIVLGKNKKRPADWVYINALKTNEHVKLPDGSNVVLRKGSEIHYSSDFGREKRNVYLNGEAYFIIGRSSLPFQVETLNGITTGNLNSFLITSRDSVERLIVLEGNANFFSNKKKGLMIVINKGERADISGQEVIRNAIEGQNYLSWQNQKLTFEKTPLTRVASDLFDYYGIPVRIAEDMNGNEIWVSGQFENRSLDSVLEEIAAKTHLIIRKDGQSIWISYPLNQRLQPEPREKKKSPPAITTLPPQKSQPPANKKNRKKWWMFWK